MRPADLSTWLAREILVHERPLRGYVSRFFKQVSDVEDVIQETYARLLALDEAERNSVRDWHAFLFTAARNVALDRLRKARIVSLDAMAEMETLHVSDERPSVYEELSSRQELALLARTIAMLPDRCREVLTLRKLYGLPQREIAQRLGISESTVEKHVANGVRLCAERMYGQVDATAPHRADSKSLNAHREGSDVE